MKPTELEMSRIKRAAEEKEVRAIIARDFSARRMSSTRWQEAIDSLQDVPYDKGRVKFVDVGEPLDGFLTPATETYFDSNWGPVLILSVEWLEIDPVQEVSQGLLLKPQRIDHSGEIKRRLQVINVPYEWVDGYIRIVGYVRDGAKEATE